MRSSRFRRREFSAKASRSGRTESGEPGVVDEDVDVADLFAEPKCLYRHTQVGRHETGVEPPRFSIATTTAAPRDAPCPSTITLAPYAASCTALASPIPDVAPVTSATLPSDPEPQWDLPWLLPTYLSRPV
jgi:hypothetical protein